MKFNNLTKYIIFLLFFIILGDSGYPLEPWLLTPFRSTSEGSREANFNTIHSKTRNIIEHTIGILKSRFRCINGARELHYSPKKASQIFNVCATLHNICLHFRVAFDDPLVENGFDETQNAREESNGNDEGVLARRIRTGVLNAIT